jgi:hypothetical protein
MSCLSLSPNRVCQYAVCGVNLLVVLEFQLSRTLGKLLELFMPYLNLLNHMTLWAVKVQ